MKLLIFLSFVLSTQIALGGYSASDLIYSTVQSAANRQNLGGIQVSFNIRNNNLHGQAFLYSSGRRAISFHQCLSNAYLTNNEQYAFVRDLALHEVAHHLAWARTGRLTGSHGKDFKQAMYDLGVYREKKSLSQQSKIRGCPIR